MAVTRYLPVAGYDNELTGTARRTREAAEQEAKRMAAEHDAWAHPQTERFDFGTRRWAKNPPPDIDYPTPYGVVEVEVEVED